MTIIREEHRSNYTVIDNGVLKDKTLSLKAIGLAAHILSMPNDWRISRESLSRTTGEGQTTIRSALSELEEHGYLRRERTRNPNGSYEWTNSFVENPSVEPIGGKPTDGKQTDIISTVLQNTVSKDTVAAGATLPLSLVEQQPTSTSSTTSLAEQYHTLLDELADSKNKAAVLVRIYVLCFGRATAPTFAYVGKVARAVGGAGRLAQLMFELIPRQVSGDKLAYITSQENARKKRVAAFNGGVKETKLVFSNGDDE